MSRPRKSIRALALVLGILVAVAVLASVSGILIVRASFPNTSGELKLPGLAGAVEVYRDAQGVPQIYADGMRDLFMAQGYVHAQERFWQMDFWRHIGAGRLSEMFGKSQVGTDTFLRAMGWAELAALEWESSSPEAKTILQAYADGVNAYLAGHRGLSLGLEYGVLELINPGYAPERWSPVNTLTWGKAMAWDLRGNIDEEIERAILLKTLKPSQVNQLFPLYPPDHPYIVSGYKVGEPGPASNEQRPLTEFGMESARTNFASLDALLGPAGSGIGSNSWVVAGWRSATGKPLLANDPHLGIQMPSIWFQNGLHLRKAPVASGASSYDVTGFSFAGVPGVIIGHNARIAWGFTNVGPDVMDLYIEKTNPANSDQYEVNGKWVDMTTRSETIKVAGGKPIRLMVRATRHGPIVSDLYLPANFRERAGIGMPAHYAVTLRWTALEPNHIFEAIWAFDKAQGWDDFREAARSFTVPAQNLVYADVDGNIGYQMPGQGSHQGPRGRPAAGAGLDQRLRVEGLHSLRETALRFQPSLGIHRDSQ